MARRVGLVRPARGAALALGLGAGLAAIALLAGGGLQLEPTTSAELVLQLAGGLLGAFALLATRGRLFGGPALVLLGALAALSALSIIWAVQPDDAWVETGRTLAYLATFGSGMALVRLAPERWSALVGATVVAAGVVAAYALATKIFPAALNPDEALARLREPFGYWNAVGLMAALGGPGCLWLGARRHGHAALNALAYPVLTLLLVTVLLAYSRGSLLALGLGFATWFAIVPLRLRGALVLGVSGPGAALIVAWVFGQAPLSADDVVLALRESSGLELGGLLAVMVTVLALAGLAVGFARAQSNVPEAARRRAGTALLVAVALVPVGLAVSLATSEPGLGGSVSDGWQQLVDPDVSAAASPGNSKNRLTAVGSVRARYFADALKLFRDRPVLGTGAGGFATARPRVRSDELDVRHAHGFAFQTLADLGLVGAAVVLALWAAWAWAALRATALVRRRRAVRSPADAELAGLRTLLAVVVVFGVHSFVDWTWFVPGPAVVALLCAGWLAGRGPSRGERGERLTLPGPPVGLGLASTSRVRALAALGLLAVAAACAWATAQPQRAVDAADSGLVALERGDVELARARTLHATRIDPLSVEPLFNLAAVERRAQRPDAELRALEEAVQLQPQNPSPWLRLAALHAERGDSRAALAALRPALFLDPRSSETVALFLAVSRRAAAPPAP